MEPFDAFRTTDQEDFRSYLVTASQSGDQLGFFSYPNYTQAAIDLFTATKGTYTLGELCESPYVSFEPELTL